MSAAAMDDSETMISGNLPSPHLAWALVVAALGFLPFGIVAILQALRASSALRAGDIDSARIRSRSARRWIIATVVFGVLVDVVIVGALLLLGAFPN